MGEGEGSKRKYDCLTSGSRQFEMTTKELATWKPTAENRPVPVNVRFVAKEFSTGYLMLERPQQGRSPWSLLTTACHQVSVQKELLL